MIHADLHFGNLVWRMGSPVPIDFDDCGHGSKLYDLGVFLYSARFGIKDQKHLRSFIDNFRTHYQGNMESNDWQILPYYILARHVSLMIWLANRTDNSKLIGHLHKFKKYYWRDVKKYERLSRKEDLL